MNGKILLPLLVVLVLVAGITGYTLATSQSNQSKQNMQQTTQTVKIQNEVILDKNGFTPSEIRVKAGNRVIWYNKSGAQASVNSGDHPTHQKYSELNLGSFADGSSVQALLEQAGTYTYHDHYHPERTGTIIVE